MLFALHSSLFTGVMWMNKILIVEDELTLAKMLEVKFKEAGFSVSIALDAYEGSGLPTM